MNRMEVVFLSALGSAVVVSLTVPTRRDADTIETHDVGYTTCAGFNIGALAVILILVALYATWW